MGSVPPHQMPFSAGNSTDTISNGSWRQVGRLCWLRLHGRHPLSTRSRCAPIRSQLCLLRLPAPASLTAGASAAASARSQILLQRERAQFIAQPDGAVDDHVRTRLPAPALPRVAPRHAEACLRGLPRPTAQPIALGRLSSLRPTGCTLPTSRPTCRRPPRGDSRCLPTSATCASRPCCPRSSRRCCACGPSSMRFAGGACRCAHLSPLVRLRVQQRRRRDRRVADRGGSARRARARRRQRAHAPRHARRRRCARGHRESEFGSVLLGMPAGRSVYASTGSSCSVTCGRVSFALRLHGPCASYDTACSASLVANHGSVLALQPASRRVRLP